jgi:transcriptional regulator with XRE-family HTH domain
VQSLNEHIRHLTDVGKAVSTCPDQGYALSHTDLAKKVGIAQSTISAVLNGSRKLTKNQVIKLAAFFNVAPAAFLPNGPTREHDNSSRDAGAPSKRSSRRIVVAPHT